MCILHCFSSFGGALPLMWRVRDQPPDSGLENQLIVCVNIVMNVKINHHSQVIDLDSLPTNCEPLFKRSATTTLSLYIYFHHLQEAIVRCKWSLTYWRYWQRWQSFHQLHCYTIKLGQLSKPSLLMRAPFPQPESSHSPLQAPTLYCTPLFCRS